MLMDLLFAASSVLLGSTISRILAKILVFQRGINLFSSGSIGSVQLFTPDFAAAKTYDLLEFILFVGISLCLFGIFYLVYRGNNYSKTKSVLIGSSFLIFGLITDLSTLFASYSGTQTLMLIAAWFLVAVWISTKIPGESLGWGESKFSVANGLITGFYLSILIHKFTTSVALPLTLFAVFPFYFYLFSSKYKFLKHPGFIILILGAIFPYNNIALFILGGISLLVIFFTRNKVSPGVIRFSSADSALRMSKPLKNQERLYAP